MFQLGNRKLQSALSAHVAKLRNLCSGNIDVKVKPVVGYWLFGVAAMVAGTVTIGGLTRITRSGLSMTDWTIHGSLPPITTEEWQVEFKRYQTFPEWKQRQSMTLSEFKQIYYWEYGHRMLGRFIGIAFVVPFSYFSYKKMIPKSMYPRLGLLFSLGTVTVLI